MSTSLQVPSQPGTVMLEAVVLQASDAGVEGRLAVPLSAGMIAGADEIVAVLPARVVELLAQPGASVALADGAPLPGWIAYDARRGALAMRAVPRDALPLQAVLGAAGMRVAVTVAPPQAAGR